MKDNATSTDHDAFIEEVKDQQRNTLWPDTFRNGHSVDAFLWKGSPDAPLVQRIGACIFGLTFILGGLGWLDVAYEKHWRVFGVLSIAWFFVGARLIRNGFSRRRTDKHESK
jgi:hypothetical protein